MAENIKAYSIDAVVWFRGMEYKVITKPYMFHGAEWQDAKSLYSDRVVTIPTPAQIERNIASDRADYAESQAGFKRL